MQLAKLQALVRYWGTDYDWRKAEAKLNALPQFVTTIDGLDIHFIHVRSRHPNALPLIMTHGWPGSVFELLKVDRSAHRSHGLWRARGGRVRSGAALDARLRLLGQPTSTGWGPERIARAWDVLMKRLGYTRYVSQGGDWGSVVADAMGASGAGGAAGHSRQHAGDRAAGNRQGAQQRRAGPGRALPRRAGRVRAHRILSTRRAAAMRVMMVTRPQTLGYSLADSPVGLAAWFYDKFADWTYSGGEPERSLTQGRDARRHHALLADQQRDLLGAALLGEQQQQLQRRGAEDGGDLGARCA